MSNIGQPAPPETEGELAEVVERNIRALVERRKRQNKERTVQDRVADGITAFTGSLRFVYLHLLIVGLWVAINQGWIPGVPSFDKDYILLAMTASVEAIFLSTFVLISQNRMAREADQRADLDLQISLLAEHEVTRLINLVSAIAEKMQIDMVHDPELSQLKKDVEPEKVMERISRS